jgi:hypothetical protein
MRYDGTTNPVEFLQLYVIAVQPRVEISVRWPIGSPWPSKMLCELGS